MTIELSAVRLAPDDLDELALAVGLIEKASLASRLTHAIGGRVESLGRAVPGPARRTIALATEGALKVALRVALRSLGHRRARRGEAAQGLQSLAQGRRRRLGRDRRRFRLRGARGGIADLDHDPAALDRGYRARRGRGPLQPGGADRLHRSFRARRS